VISPLPARQVLRPDCPSSSVQDKSEDMADSMRSSVQRDFAEIHAFRTDYHLNGDSACQDIHYYNNNNNNIYAGEPRRVPSCESDPP
jgi:hypothetical protein